MTDTIMSTDHKADLKAWIARLDQRIEAVKHDITCLQGGLDNPDIERAAHSMNSTNSKTRRTAPEDEN